MSVGFRPAWSVGRADEVSPVPGGPWPPDLGPQWAWGGADGAGTRVCILDSGIDPDHPWVGPVAGSFGVVAGDGGSVSVQPEPPADLAGHGTACAGIIRSLAPAAEITSVRVLTSGITGTGAVLEAALGWAVAQRFDVVNLSLSTRRAEIAERLRPITDEAWFSGVMVVASAHNSPVLSFPWAFASVISVSSHAEPDAWLHYFNPSPPALFQAHGVAVDVAWTGGGTRRVTGNSFATPHVSALLALIRSRHPGLTSFQAASILHLAAANVGRRPVPPSEGAQA